MSATADIRFHKAVNKKFPIGRCLFLGNRTGSVLEVDNFTAIVVQMSRQCRILDTLQPYRLASPVTGPANMNNMLNYCGNWVT